MQHTYKRVTDLFYSLWDKAFMVIGTILFSITGVIMLLRNLNMGLERLLVGLSAMGFCLCFAGACLSLYMGMRAELTSNKESKTVVTTLLCFVLGMIFLMLAVVFSIMNTTQS